MVEVGIHSLWTNRQQQNTKSLGSAIKKLERKKKSVITKNPSLVKPVRRKDTTKLGYTFKKLNYKEFNGLQEIFGWAKE